MPTIYFGGMLVRFVLNLEFSAELQVFIIRFIRRIVRIEHM